MILIPYFISANGIILIRGKVQIGKCREQIPLSFTIHGSFDVLPNKNSCLFCPLPGGIGGPEHYWTLLILDRAQVAMTDEFCSEQ